MTQHSSWTYQDTTPDDSDAARLADTIAARPGAIKTLLRDSPRSIPALLQEALRRGDDLVGVIETAMAADVARGGGVGKGFDALFMAALELDGEHAVAVRLRLRALVADRDRRLSRTPTRFRRETTQSFDGKDRLLDLADRDPAAARLYVRFRQRPRDAAKQLLDEAMLVPTLFERHVVYLGGWMQDVMSSARFADEVRRLEGPNAERVKRFVLRELYGLASAAAASVRAARGTSGATDAHVCVERLVPIIAALVADTEVAWLLVGGADDVPGLPSVRSLCELLLDRCFSLAVQVEVRLALTHGGVDLLWQAAEQAGESTDDVEMAAELLGAVARTQRSIGIEDNVALQMTRIADALTTTVPGARAVAAATICRLLGFTGVLHHGVREIRDAIAGLLGSAQPLRDGTRVGALWCDAAAVVMQSTIVR